MVQELLIRTIVSLVSTCFWVQYVICHLKDLGEVVPSRNISMLKRGLTIQGGVQANRLDFPFNVIFLNFGGLCGGTILARKVVLTAGHCFTSNTNVSEMKILSNARNILDFKSTIHLVWSYTVHEEYGKGQAFANDIAVILIHDTFTYSKNVQPAFLVNTDTWMDEKETNFTISGWGSHKFGEGILNLIKGRKLMKANMRFVSKAECETRNSVTLSPEMFCLYGDRERDTCQGDSGGNVLWKGSVVGIVSHGQRCGEEPSVYINVYYMQSWIRKTTKELYKKYCGSHKKNKGFTE